MINELIEVLAQRCRKVEVLGMKTVYASGSYSHRNDGSFVISKAEDEALTRLIQLEYDDLTEEAKDRYRRQAHRIVEQMIELSNTNISPLGMPVTVQEILANWTDEMIETMLAAEADNPQFAVNAMKDLRDLYIRNMAVAWTYMTAVLADHVALLKSSNDRLEALQKQLAAYTESASKISINVTAAMTDADVKKMADLAMERMVKAASELPK
jgi:hypothetical protein